MTDLRKAAEMALEALETLNSGDTYKTHNAATALRQALAQPEQDELLKQGWRQCAVGQRTTQYCGMAEQARLEEREACARMCDLYGMPDGISVAALTLAKAIRARGEK